MEISRRIARIRGGKALRGEIEVSGSKNSVLAILAATLLSRGTSVIHNVPDLLDVRSMCHLLRILGAKVRFHKGTVTIDTSTCDYHEVPYQLVRSMRASIYVLGPLVAKLGRARVPLPGGCAWGPRPVNFHLDGLRELGADLEVEHGDIEARATRLRGTELNFKVSSVGATANLMMAATLAEGNTSIKNAALEPEIVDLAEFLVQMGARIRGIGTSTIEIEGVRELHPTDYEVIPDRIEAATLLLAGAITRGKVRVSRCLPTHLAAVLHELQRSGLRLSIGHDSIELDGTPALLPVHIQAKPFPAFPTDVQAQMTAYLATISGRSRVEDSIYSDRFQHIPELCRLGARIEMDSHGALIEGGHRLSGAPVQATDLRASAALILAGLAAEGTTVVSGLEHLERGYEKLFDKLAILGAEVECVAASTPRLPAQMENGGFQTERLASA